MMAWTTTSQPLIGSNSKEYVPKKASINGHLKIYKNSQSEKATLGATLSVLGHCGSSTRNCTHDHATTILRAILGANSGVGGDFNTKISERLLLERWGSPGAPDRCLTCKSTHAYVSRSSSSCFEPRRREEITHLCPCQLERSRSNLDPHPSHRFPHN